MNEPDLCRIFAHTLTSSASQKHKRISVILRRALDFGTLWILRKCKKA